MTRLTDKDALYTELVKMKDFGELTAKKAIRAVENAPTIDAEPVRHGKWIVTTEGVVECSECKRKFILLKENYCPNCGARMDAE